MDKGCVLLYMFVLVYKIGCGLVIIARGRSWVCLRCCLCSCVGFLGLVLSIWIYFELLFGFWDLLLRLCDFMVITLC